MVFVETTVFTRRVRELMDDDAYAELQHHLAAHPEAGALIRGSGGLRKIRWAAHGRGKRGGVRVIYYWWVTKDRVSLLYLYPKNEQDDLTPVELKLLKKALADLSHEKGNV